MLASQIVTLFTSNYPALVDLFSRMCWPPSIYAPVVVTLTLLVLPVPRYLDRLEPVFSPHVCPLLQPG